MMSANVVGNVAVQDVGEDEGGGAIPCRSISHLALSVSSQSSIPMITVSTHTGSERAMDCDSSVPLGTEIKPEAGGKGVYS